MTHDEIVFQTAAALRLEYANKPVQTGTTRDGDPKFEPLFDTWLRSPNRRDFRRVVFSPLPLRAFEGDFNM